MRTELIGIAGAMIAASAGAQQPASPAARTVQQDYDAATALSAGPDRAAALAAWEALEQRTRAGSRTRAIALVRKGRLLWMLRRDEDAVAALRAGLAGLPAGDATLVEDRFNTLAALAGIARSSLDYAGAADLFARALAVADTPALRIGAALSQVETLVFVDPVAARAALAGLDALVAANPVAPEVAAAVARRHALLALNTGDLATARTQSAAAVKLLGGLSQKTSLTDVAARGDAALALILSGQPDKARQYLAMTGAGRIPKVDFDPAAAMTAPDCGGEQGLKPADLAVVEFSIEDDGSVLDSAPVYAAGGGTVGLEFARAARSWAWTPGQAKQLPAFYRHNVRVEMRCSTDFEKPSVTGILRGDLEAWLAAKGVTVPEKPLNSAAALPAQRAAVAALGNGDIPLARMPALLAFIDNPVASQEEKDDPVRRALALARANGAPPTAILALVVQGSGSVAWESEGIRQARRDPAGHPVYGKDPQARSALRLMYADTEKGAKGIAALRAVIDDPDLKPNDPMRVGALVRLSSREQSRGDIAAARATFERSGLAANQCALLDAPPRMLAVGGTFPMAAQLWGFEGWTRTQFDVDATGRVVGERAILSYPAFVFTKAGLDTMKGARFSKSFRPDGGLGCGSLTQNVRFKLPG